MYGLLIENLASFIRVQWGEGKWDSVRKHAGVDAPSFSIHHVYAETLLARLARSATQILGVDERQFFEAMGVYFVEFVGVYGYDQMLSVLGRHLRDFLNGLDNLHEYLKFSYTKMRAPSFYCDNESATGLRLHYRSKRRGFVWYTMGQIKQVAKHFYEQDIEIEVISEELDGETMHTIFKLTFDNIAYVEHENLRSIMKKESQLPIRASIIFELFPFCIVFSTEMVITYTGHALLTILKDLVGQGMTEAFEIIRPLIAFSFQTILERSNNIFELVTTSPIKEESLDKIMEDEEAEGVHLKLRGQMLHMEEWNMILFLANPVMPDVASLTGAGIFINDLSLHDCSRDLVLAGTQQSVELKLALDQEQHKSKKLEESMKKLDEEMKRTDELLYQMIPKQVADRLRTGENAVQTCEVFDIVSILFSDVVTFTDICSRITPMQVVSMLNHMYSLFDQLTERNGVYKVETIGDSYMVVSGAPVKEPNHAERVADMAMDMIDAMKAIKDPSKPNEDDHLKLRVGCHSGMVVAGVVGVKMPRYCLFGDAVNTASRMESTSEGSRIQISEDLTKLLPPTYKFELRGTVNVKGKGEMNTYWLLGRESRVPLSKIQAGSFDWTEPGMKQERRYSKTSDKGGSRKSSVISTDGDATTGKSREPTTSSTLQTPAQQQPQKKVEQAVASSQPSKKALPPKIDMSQVPKIIKTPAESDSPKPKKQASTEDSQGNQMSLNTAGKEVYASARRLSNALRSRSPSPTPEGSGKETTVKRQQSTEDSKGNQMTLNKAGKEVYASARRISDALRSRSSSPIAEVPEEGTSAKKQQSTEDSKGNKLDLNVAGKEVYDSARRLSDALRNRSPSPTGDTSGGDRSRQRTTAGASKPQTSEPTAASKPADKKVTLMRQVTLAELPDKLAEVLQQPPGETVSIVKVPAKDAKGELRKTAGKGEDIICIVPTNNNNNSEGGVEADDQERESFLINVKMKQGPQQENGGPNGLKRTINGIAVGISRLPKNEALRKKIRESKIAVVTADVLTDMGCGGFADKQKQVISQACSIL